MSDIDLQIALMESGRMNLMHLPPGAISWLWDRPTKQIDAAESLAVAANAHGNPVVDASLLKADQNILLIKCEGGECFRIYPDGGFSHNDSPMDIGGCSSVLQGMQQDECPMDDNGHQMDMPMGGDMMPVMAADTEMAALEAMGDDEHLDAEPPESGVATPVGMTNIAGEPTMDESDSGVSGLSMGGSSGTPYVGDMSMDANQELDNLVSARELGEASIHMFRNETDDSLSDLANALGLNEMYMDSDAMADAASDAAYDEAHQADQMTVEAYDDSSDQYKEVFLLLDWEVEPTEYDGQYISSQGGASVEKIELAQPVQINGKVHTQMDDELAANILATEGQGYTSIYDYINAQLAGKIDVPQHRYPDSTR